MNTTLAFTSEVLALAYLGIVAWYLGAKAYRRRRGINISLAFQQIPIE